jgi:hypothetical protein
MEVIGGVERKSKQHIRNTSNQNRMYYWPLGNNRT